MNRRKFLKGATATVGAAGLVTMSNPAAASGLTKTGSSQYLTNGEQADITMHFLTPADSWSSPDAGTIEYYIRQDLAGLNHEESPHPDVLHPDHGYPVIEIVTHEYDGNMIDKAHSQADDVLEGTSLEGTTDPCFWLIPGSDIDDGGTYGRGFERTEATDSSSYHPLMDDPSLAYSDHPNIWVAIDEGRLPRANAFLSTFIRTNETVYWNDGSAPGDKYTENEETHELAEGYLEDIDNYTGEATWEASFLIQWSPAEIASITTGDCQTPNDAVEPQYGEDVSLRFHSSSFRPYVHPFSSCTSNTIQDTIDWMGW